MKQFRLVCVGYGLITAALAGTEAEFKKKSEDKYNELQKLLKEKSSPEVLERFIRENFDVDYVASNACKQRLSADSKAKLRPAIEKIGRYIFKGEAIQKVIDSTIDASKMVVTLKKSMTFVNGELSDGTKFTMVFLANGKLIDVRCVGISLVKVLDTVIEKYCAANGISFRSKTPADRADIAKSAIEWHIAGQPKVTGKRDK